MAAAGARGAEPSAARAALTGVFAGMPVPAALLAPGGEILGANPALVALSGHDETELMGRPFAELVVADDPASATAELLLRPEDPADDAAGSVRRPASCVRADGSRAEVTLQVTRLAGGPMLLAVVEDESGRRAEAARRDAHGRREAALARIGEAAAFGLDLATLLERTVTLLRTALGVERTALFVPGENGELRLTAGAGWPRGPLGRTAGQPTPGTLAAAVLRSEVPLVSADLAAGRHGVAAPLLLDERLTSAVEVRVPGRAGPFGYLGAYTALPRAFDAGEEAFVAGVARLLAAVVAQREEETDLRRGALRDALTALPNRTLLLDRLDLTLARARRAEAPVAVLHVDVDGFAALNDEHGPGAADEVLVTVADRLRDHVRHSDTVARVGADSFVVVCEDVREGTAVALAERLTASFTRPFPVGDRDVFVSVSIGIAMWRPASPAGRGDLAARQVALLRDAETAATRAAEQGGSRYEVFDPRMRARARNRLRIESALRRAVERAELTVLYQPMVAIADGRAVGAEALVRWIHADGSQTAPDAFIPVADDTGLVTDIGGWVLEEACRQAVTWNARRSGRPFVVSVNLSARQLAEQEVVERVRGALAGTGAKAAWLELEVPESALSGEDADAVAGVLQRLKALGVRLSVDDFGTGSSALARLRRFPVDALKVDRAFVNGLGNDAEDSTLVASVVALARALGLEVVAEGIETPEQVQALLALGCTYGQGYHFARPLPAAAVDRMVAGLPPVPSQSLPPRRPAGSLPATGGPTAPPVARPAAPPPRQGVRLGLPRVGQPPVQ